MVSVQYFRVHILLVVFTAVLADGKYEFLNLIFGFFLSRPVKTRTANGISAMSTTGTAREIITINIFYWWVPNFIVSPKYISIFMQKCINVMPFKMIKNKLFQTITFVSHISVTEKDRKMTEKCQLLTWFFASHSRESIPPFFIINLLYNRKPTGSITLLQFLTRNAHNFQLIFTWQNYAILFHIICTHSICTGFGIHQVLYVNGNAHVIVNTLSLYTRRALSVQLSTFSCSISVSFGTENLYRYIMKVPSVYFIFVSNRNKLFLCCSHAIDDIMDIGYKSTKCFQKKKTIKVSSFSGCRHFCMCKIW